MSNYVQLYRSLGYTFNDSTLLTLALTHRSLHGRINNERLEFLGDSIINFVIAQALFDAFDQAREGELTRLRAELVSGNSLAAVARELGLGEFLNLGQGESRSGGHRRDSILADTLEAVLGGIFLDSGIDQCRVVVLKWFAHRLDNLSLELPKDAKTQLQEILQSRRLALPEYQLVSTVGQPPDQTFYVQCLVSELNIEGQGSGGARRQAEQVAAQVVLDQIVKKPDNTA